MPTFKDSRNLKNGVTNYCHDCILIKKSKSYSFFIET